MRKNYQIAGKKSLFKEGEKASTLKIRDFLVYLSDG